MRKDFCLYSYTSDSVSFSPNLSVTSDCSGFEIFKDFNGLKFQIQKNSIPKAGKGSDAIIRRIVPLHINPLLISTFKPASVNSR